MPKKPQYLNQLYFAYGSNLHLEQMFRRCPDAVQVASGILDNHRLTFRGNYRGSGVADVIPAEGKQVIGGLFMVSYRDLLALDRYEGYPKLYNRHTVQIETEEDGPVKAFVYRMLDHFTQAAPADYYFGVICEGYEDWGFNPRRLVDSLESVKQELKGLA